MPYLVDSDLLIDISRGKPAAREYTDALPEGWAISQISALELIVGARDNRDLADIDTFLSAYAVVPVRGPLQAGYHRSGFTRKPSPRVRQPGQRTERA